MLRYEHVPFMKVRQLRFERNEPYVIKFKLSHGDEEFCSAYIGTNARTTKTKSRGKIPTINVLSPRIQQADKSLNPLKVKDLVSMLPYMPLVDQEFYKSVNIY